MFIHSQNKVIKIFFIVFVFCGKLIASDELFSCEDFHLERERLFLENSNLDKNLLSENSLLKSSATLCLLKNFRNDINCFLKKTKSVIEYRSQFRNFDNNDDIIKEIFSETLQKYDTNNFTIRLNDLESSYQDFFINLYKENIVYDDKILFLFDRQDNLFIDVPRDYQIDNVNFLTKFDQNKQYLFFHGQNHFIDFSKNLINPIFSIECIFVEFFNKKIETLECFMKNIPKASIIGFNDTFLRLDLINFPSNQFFINCFDDTMCRIFPCSYYCAKQLIEHGLIDNFEKYSFFKNKNNNYDLFFKNEVKDFSFDCIDFFYYVVKHGLIDERYLCNYIDFAFKNRESYQFAILYYLLKETKELFNQVAKEKFYDHFDHKDKKYYWFSVFENIEIYKFLKYFSKKDLKIFLEYVFVCEYFLEDTTDIVFAILYRYLEYFFSDTFYQNGPNKPIDGEFTDILISSLVTMYDKLNHQIDYNNLVERFLGEESFSGMMINIYFSDHFSRPKNRIKRFLESINTHPELHPFFNDMYKVFYKSKRVVKIMQKTTSGIAFGLQQAYEMTNPSFAAKLFDCMLQEKTKKFIRPFYYLINRVTCAIFILFLLRHRKKIISYIPETYRLQWDNQVEKLKKRIGIILQSALIEK